MAAKRMNPAAKNARMKGGAIRTMTAAVRDFHPDHVFDCGQCFRWNREADGSYTGIAGGEIAKISFSRGKEDGAGCLTVSGAAQTSALTDDEWKAHWFDYLDLHRDYGEIKRQLCSGDPVMEEAVSFGSGIRLLRQDPWEAVICFIISQNNNIPRIKKCVESLCQTWGEYRGEFCGKKYYDYPSPEVLASLTAEDLAPCRLGYRAKYLTAAGRMAAEQGRQQLNGLRDEAVSYREAFDCICRFPGVGPKVANCILLFSLGKYESFPLDVWMKKVMTCRYGISDVREMETFAREHFGKYGGFAQQYLFYCEKEKGQPEKAKIEKI